MTLVLTIQNHNNSWSKKYSVKGKLFLIGTGDNLQLFVSPLLNYEEWLYKTIDDTNFEINLLEPNVQGSEDSHIPIGTCRNEKK